MATAYKPKTYYHACFDDGELYIGPGFIYPEEAKTWVQQKNVQELDRFRGTGKVPDCLWFVLKITQTYAVHYKPRPKLPAQKAAEPEPRKRTVRIKKK